MKPALTPWRLTVARSYAEATAPAGGPLALQPVDGPAPRGEKHRIHGDCTERAMNSGCKPVPATEGESHAS